LLGRDGRLNQAWAFWFREFAANLPPSGSSGYVINGTSGPLTIYTGPAVNRGTATEGSIYFSTDTGEIFIAVAGQWVREIPEFTGDVTNTVGSKELTLKTVNLSPGTWGGVSSIPVITVDSKGRVTAVTQEPFTLPAGLTPGGPTGSVQFNLDGVLAGTPGFQYSIASNTLQTQNQAITGVVTYANPAANLNNLSPLTSRGDLLTKDGLIPNNHIRVPVGTDGQVLTADSTETAGFRWATPASTDDGTTPYYVPEGETFVNKLYKQNLFNTPITIDGTLEVNGLLVEV
jgi:trimeric autotransporter adhesin